MENIKQYQEKLSLCYGAQFNQNISGWEKLTKYDNLTSNKKFDASVYKQVY